MGDFFVEVKKPSEKATEALYQTLSLSAKAIEKLVKGHTMRPGGEVKLSSGRDTSTSNHASRTRRGRWHFSPTRSLRRERLARVGHFQQRRVWSIATGNLLTLSKRQLADCITVDSACNDELMNNGFAFAVKNAQRPVTVTVVSQPRALARPRIATLSSLREVSRGYRGVSNDSEQALMSAVAQQQHDRLGGDSLQDCAVFSRVTRVACADYVSDDRAKANSLTGTVPGGDVYVVLNDVLASLKMRTVAAKP